MTDDWRDDMDQWFHRAAGRYFCDRKDDDDMTPELLVSRIARAYEFFVNTLPNDCESPLEAIILAQLLLGNDGYNDLIFNPFPGQNPDPDFGTTFTPQENIGRHRVDFLLTVHCKGKKRRLVVECDGHAFHEKTKEQARRDKSRDRDFAKAGIAVLHFTGSEIYRDPSICLDEITALLSMLADEVIKEAQREFQA